MKITLRDQVKQHLENYFANLAGHKTSNLYAMVLQEIEIPLIQKALEHTENNISKAADILGISRGTLRKKIFYLKDFL